MMLLCQIVGHQRSKAKIHPDSVFVWRSQCRHCGAPMVRLSHKDWRIESDVSADSMLQRTL